MDMIPVYIIIALVFIVLPVVLARLTGSNPMEILFGKRVNNTLFGKKNPEETKTENTEDGKADKADKAKAPGRKKGGKAAPLRNSTKQELLSFISDLINYCRRNRFYSLVPGTLELDGEISSFSAIVVTRSAVLAFNCFGYGGDIFCVKDKDSWTQVMDGKENEIPSPVIRNQKQKEILEKALERSGFKGVKSQVYGVFTAPSAVLKNRSGTDCYTKKDMMNILQGDSFLNGRGVDPKKVGQALEKLVKRA